MIRCAAYLLTALIGVATMTVSAPHAAADPRVDMSSMTLQGFEHGFAAEAHNPGGSLPGTNDFGCRPSAAHPNPVVLLHGTFMNRQTNWGAYAPLLSSAGYCVFSLTYGAMDELPWPLSTLGGQHAIADGATEVGPFVESILTATGADKVDIVAHSLGTLTGGYYIKKLGGAARVAHMVSLTPVWGGSRNPLFTAGLEVTQRLGVNPSQIPLCQSCVEGAPNSGIIDTLNESGTPYVSGVEYTNISTRYDTQVVPYDLGQIPAHGDQRVHNVVLQDGCESDRSDHLSAAFSPRAATFVLNALDPAGALRVPC